MPGSSKALIAGIGICDLLTDEVDRFCDWEVQRDPTGLSFFTEQAHHGYALNLKREVTLSGRTVTSSTRLHNTGGLSIPVRWYPHPFFPQPEDDELCRFNTAVAFDEGGGYELAESGFVRRRGWPWETDFYMPLDHEAGVSLTVLQRHPALGLVAASCSYVPGFLVIWGNQRTFSFEPYFERTLGAGQEAAWTIRWDF
jgi:hypothetical protein